MPIQKCPFQKDLKLEKIHQEGSQSEALKWPQEAPWLCPWSCGARGHPPTAFQPSIYSETKRRWSPVQPTVRSVSVMVCENNLDRIEVI